MESEGSRRQNAGPTNRNHIEADMLGEKANRFKAQILSGKHGRRCGGHKREGKCALPGEICPEQRAEVSRGQSKPGVSCRDEGLNMKLRERDLVFDGGK